MGHATLYDVPVANPLDVSTPRLIDVGVDFVDFGEDGIEIMKAYDNRGFELQDSDILPATLPSYGSNVMSGFRLLEAIASVVISAERFGSGSVWGFTE